MRPWVPLLAMLLAGAGLPAVAQDFELEFTEEGLNRLVGRLGDPSSGGFYQPNPTSALGYANCRFFGALDCPGSRPAGGSSGRVVLSVCEGRDGGRRVVPGAEPVSWQWWITEAHFSLNGQQLLFAATVRYRVGTQWFKEEGTAPATMRLDIASQRLRLDVSTLKIPIRHAFGTAAPETLAEVDVGRMMSFAIPISAQTFQVRDLDGGVKTLTSRAQGGNVEYLPGKIRVSLNASFY